MARKYFLNQVEDQEKNTIFWEQRKKPIKFPKFASSSPRPSKRMEILKQKIKVALVGIRLKLVEMVSLMIIIIALNNRNLSLTNKEKY
jgi:hypothetical protein